MLYVVTKDQSPDPPNMVNYHGYLVCDLAGNVINTRVILTSLDEVAAFIAGHSGGQCARFDIKHHTTQAVTVGDGRLCIDYWTTAVVTTA